MAWSCVGVKPRTSEPQSTPALFRSCLTRFARLRASAGLKCLDWRASLDIDVQEPVGVQTLERLGLQHGESRSTSSGARFVVPSIRDLGQSPYNTVTPKRELGHYELRSPSVDNSGAEGRQDKTTIHTRITVGPEITGTVQD